MVLLWMKGREATVFTTAVSLGAIRVEEVVMPHRNWFGTAIAFTKPHPLLLVPLGQQTEYQKLPEPLIPEL
jgi:hypothetical protein